VTTTAVWVPDIVCHCSCLASLKDETVTLITGAVSLKVAKALNTVWIEGLLYQFIILNSQCTWWKPYHPTSIHKFL
jgi:hypothetical protein